MSTPLPAMATPSPMNPKSALRCKLATTLSSRLACPAPSFATSASRTSPAAARRAARPRGGRSALRRLPHLPEPRWLLQRKLGPKRSAQSGRPWSSQLYLEPLRPSPWPFVRPVWHFGPKRAAQSFRTPNPRKPPLTTSSPSQKASAASGWRPTSTPPFNP